MEKVVAMVGRGGGNEEFVQFLAALATLPRTILKNRMNSSFSFISSWCNSSYNSNRPVQNSLRGKELNKFFPPKQKRRPLPFLLSSSFFYGMTCRAKVKYPRSARASPCNKIFDSFRETNVFISCFLFLHIFLFIF